MKLVLTIDGGGTMGIIPAEICAELESLLKVKIYKAFDLISGTSTGAILGSCLAAGTPADECRRLYLERGPALFKARTKWFPWNWVREKYDRKPIVREIKKTMLDKSECSSINPRMRKLKTRFMCTSVSLVDERNHFFKSWDKKDGDMRTVDAVERSFAAAYYFGAVDDPSNKQVWADGGEGGDNCTIRQCAIESLMTSWFTDSVYILSLGCGYVKPGIPYKQARKKRWVGEVKFYMNLARRQSAKDQVFEIQTIAKKMGHKLDMDRLNIEVPAKMDKLDGVEYISDLSKMTIEKLSDRVKEIADKVIKLKNL